MTDVLAGVRVLEVAEQGFVPSAAAVLADWGADVVKLERPEGDGLRAVMRQGLVAQTGDFDFLVEQVNRNKRNVCLDLIFSFFATPSEVQSDPQVLANGYLPRHPTHPTARLAASPVQFDEEPVVIRSKAPGKGEHSDEVLEGLGFGAAERARLRESGALG